MLITLFMLFSVHNMTGMYSGPDELSNNWWWELKSAVRKWVRHVMMVTTERTMQEMKDSGTISKD